MRLRRLLRLQEGHCALAKSHGPRAEGKTLCQACLDSKREKRRAKPPPRPAVSLEALQDSAQGAGEGDCARAEPMQATPHKLSGRQ